MKKYVSIDIGGTEIKYGLIDEKGQILTRSKMKTEAYKGGPSILEKAVRIVEAYQALEEISGICISTAGMVDTEKGEIFYAAAIPNMRGQIQDTMIQKFSLPCEVENDVNCAGLAEYMSGASKGTKASLMLTVGTGIGGCIIIDGKVYHGCSSSACEIGYMLMDGSDFQTLGAASILSKKVAAWKNEPEEQWDGYRIFEAAKAGDELCCRAIDEMVDVLGKGIANICYVLNPEVVVLGGGIMAQEEYLAKKIRGAVDKYLVASIASRIRICPQHRMTRACWERSIISEAFMPGKGENEWNTM